ncbi:MAG TPA: ArsR family transcriptional regulator [Burkholderiaceae bacterium]
MARTFTHPSLDDITIDGVLHALADPLRRNMVRFLLENGSTNCSDCSCPEISASTVSFHTKILRESGLIHSEKVGVSVINSVRYEELNKRFPGLLDTILRYNDAAPAKKAA